jgi:hypothetical protein
MRLVVEAVPMRQDFLLAGLPETQAVEMVETHQQMMLMQQV